MFKGHIVGMIALSLVAVCGVGALAGGNLGNLGTFHKWHKVEVALTGPSTSVTADPNPFLILVNVSFTGPGGSFTVPAFYDGDGSGGSSGSVWKVRFSPNATGSWTFTSSSADATLNGYTGSFTVDPAPGVPAGTPAFLRRGRLQYVGGHYLKFADGGYWIKAGVDDPENWLGAPFGNWIGKKAAIDQLSGKGVSSIYCMLNTITPGDTNDTWPWYGSTPGEAQANSSRYNVGKLAEWEGFFGYCESKGIVLHIVLDDDSAWHDYDHSLYYREMIARFGHHPALIWNIGEEANENYSDSEQLAFAQAIRNWDPYDHPLTVHRNSDLRSNWPFLGNSSFDLTSIQVGSGGDDFTSATLNNLNTVIINNRNGSVSAGRPVAVMIDEIAGLTAVNQATRLKMRSEVLYPIFLGGGHFELHYLPGPVTLDTLGPIFDEMRLARGFVEQLPFDQMSPDNSLLSVTTGNFCLAKPGLAYGVYLKNGGTVDLNLTGVVGAYQVRWHNVTSLATTAGPVITGGGWRSLGAPAYTGDVACSVTRSVAFPKDKWAGSRVDELRVGDPRGDGKPANSRTPQLVTRKLVTRSRHSLTPPFFRDA